MKRFLMKVCYDGSAYCGWQSQNNGISVQQKLEECIFQITKENVSIVGSGRPDAGVSAKGQICHFDSETKIRPINLAKAVNNLLPEDISIIEIKIVSDDFHARFSAKRKQYQYDFYVSELKNALLEKNTLRIYNVDIEKMKQATRYFKGKHSFKAFCSAKAVVKDFEREIYNISLTQNEETLSLKICGNGFLYNMVRIIAGTILEVGQGKINLENIPDIFKNEDRSLAGKTLPAKALTLVSVEYDKYL